MGAASGAPAGGWVGRYAYTETHRGPEKTGIVVEHRLDVRRSAKGLEATLHSEGYQNPGTTLLCRADKKPHRLRLFFRSYEGGKTTNQFGVAVYKPGQLLLTLRRSRRRLVTEWSGYIPAAGKASPGLYFKPE